MQVGIVVGMPLSGALAASFGWETVFYVFGEPKLPIWWTVFHINFQTAIINNKNYLLI